MILGRIAGLQEPPSCLGRNDRQAVIEAATKPR
jgi:hypothetical protein